MSLMSRQAFHWKVRLQAETGEVVDFPVSSYWSPDKEGTAIAIGEAAKAEAFMESKGKVQFHPITVERVQEGVRA